jgi:hypothetical protein
LYCIRPLHCYGPYHLASIFDSTSGSCDDVRLRDRPVALSTPGSSGTETGRFPPKDEKHRWYADPQGRKSVRSQHGRFCSRKAIVSYHGVSEGVMGGSTASPRFLFKCYIEHPFWSLYWRDRTFIIRSPVSAGPVAVETRAVVFARADQETSWNFNFRRVYPARMLRAGANFICTTNHVPAKWMTIGPQSESWDPHMHNR